MKAIHHMNEHFMNIYFSISVLKCARSLNHLMCQRVSNYRIYIYIYLYSFFVQVQSTTKSHQQRCPVEKVTLHYILHSGTLTLTR